MPILAQPQQSRAKEVMKDSQFNNESYRTYKITTSIPKYACKMMSQLSILAWRGTHKTPEIYFCIPNLKYLGCRQLTIIWISNLSGIQTPTVVIFLVPEIRWWRHCVYDSGPNLHRQELQGDRLQLQIVRPMFSNWSRQFLPKDATQENDSAANLCM